MNKTYNTNEFEANRQLEIINELKSRYDEEYQRTKVKKTFI